MPSKLLQIDMDGQLDPWELPPGFVMAKKSSNLRAPSGYWKEKEGEREFIAIRSAESSPSSGSPSYQGARRTLEFYRKDGTRGGAGTKTDWIIHEYLLLRKDDDGEALFLEEDMVLCKVFQKGAADQNSTHLRYPHFFDTLDKCLENYKKARCKDPSDSDVDSECNIFLCRDITDKTAYQLTLLENNLNKAASTESHNVWQHFTKIRGKDDPDEVYAACHRCDKVLKAHPKKHGTSHLTRHTCSRCYNPSTDEDREMLRLLRAYKQQQTDGKQLEREESNVDLAQLHPRDLLLTHPTPWYFTSSLNRQTQAGGHWKEIKMEFTAIRMDQQGCWKDIQKQIAVIQMVQVPQYMGLRRTLQFHHQDGRKMDWIMLEYQQLDDTKSPALLLQGDMVIRKVFRYDKDAAASAFSDLNRLLNGDDDSEEYYYKGEGVNTETTTSSDYMNGGGDRKRKRSASSKRTSEVWMYFTEIRTADHDVVYAVCHHCDRGYGTARSSNGTSQLWRHKKRCTSKLPGTGNVNNGAKPPMLHGKQKSGHYSFTSRTMEKQSIGHQGCAEARGQEDGPTC